VGSGAGKASSVRLKDLILDSFPGVGKTVSIGRRRRWARQLTASVEQSPEDWPEAQGVLDEIRTAAGVQQIVFGTRRSAKTNTIGLGFGEALITRDGYVLRCLGRTLQQLAQNWWERDGDGGFLGLLRQHKIPHRTVRTGGLLHAIEFPWGSKVTLHPCETLHQIDLLRGQEADGYWIDEAQSLRLIAPLLLEVIAYARMKRRAALVMSGTPDEHMDGLFYGAIDAARWSTHRLSVWGNPYMPPALPLAHGRRARWVAALSMTVDSLGQQYGVTAEQVDLLLSLDPWELDATLAGNAPDRVRPLVTRSNPLCLPAAIQRELLGLWVASTELYVHPVAKWAPRVYWCVGENKHRVDVPDGLPRLVDLGSRVWALPATRGQGKDTVRRTWTLAVGYDAGSTDPAALWMAALDREAGEIYELWSEKHANMSDDEQFAWLKRKVEEAIQLFTERFHRPPELYVVADADGGKRAAWSNRLQVQAGLTDLAIVYPIKQGEAMQRREINLLLARGGLRCIAGDPCDLEQRYLQWRRNDTEIERDPDVDKYRSVTLPDGTRCAKGAPHPPLGDHCLDARRYTVITGYVMAGARAAA
jgi:hypothetical protein